MKERCTWTGNDPYNIKYHDEEWGSPVYDDRKLFEFLILEGAQAGLSWITILKKRDRYREVFDQFDPLKISVYDEEKVAQLLADPGIIRNRLKVNAAIVNARLYKGVTEEYGSFSKYLWRFTEGKPLVNKWSSIKEVPARTEISDRMSKDLQKRGFKFVGSTICYAFMQAVGMVNDHTTNCFRYHELTGTHKSGH